MLDFAPSSCGRRLRLPSVRPRAAQTCCERGWALYDPERHGAHAFTFGGHDPGVCSRRTQAVLETWCLGQLDLARARYEEGLALARKLNHPQIVLHALAKGLRSTIQLRPSSR